MVVVNQTNIVEVDQTVEL